MRTASTSERPNAKEFASAKAKFVALKDRARKLDDNASNATKGEIVRGLLGVLPTIREHKPEMGKAVRRVIRSMGHFISRDGYDVKSAKPRKTTRKANANATKVETPVVNANAENANANV